MKQVLLALHRYAPWRALDRWVGYSERRRLLDRSLDAQRIVLKGRILEIGAGHSKRRGRFIPPADQVDVWLMLDVERANQPHVVADIQILPFPERCFNAILCLEVLEYLDEPHRALSEMRRVLKPGGILVLSIPFLHRADSPRDTWRLTQNGLQWLLSETDFVIETIESQGTALLVVANTLKFVIYLIKRRLLRIIVAALMWLPLMILRWFDEPLADRMPVLHSYSTGFLIRARTASPEEAMQSWDWNDANM